MSKIGRNDPCPCGSGRKYKKCCLPSEEIPLRANALPNNEKAVSAALRPDVETAIDHILQKLEMGAGSLVESEIVELLRLHPDYHTTNYAMGVYHANVKKDPARALPYFEKALTIQPAFAEAHFNRAMCARSLFDIPKAVLAFRDVLRYTADSGLAEMARKELRFLQETLTQNGPFKTLDAYVANAQLFDRAFQCLVDHDFPQAVELFKRVLDENPNHVQSHGNLALAYFSQGCKALAIASLDRALELDPDYEPAQSNRRVAEKMREGEPFLLPSREVHYYAEALRDKTRA